MDSQDALHDPGQAPADALKNRSLSPSSHAHQQYNDHIDSSGLTIDPSITNNTSYPPSSFANNPPASSESFAFSSSYLTPSVATDQSFSRPSLQIPQSFDHGLPSQAPDENFSNLLNSNNSDFDFSLYQNTGANTTTGTDYPSSHLFDPQQSTNHAVNPVDLVSQIPSPHPSTSSQTSPLDQQPQHSSPNAMSPPASSPGTLYTPQHSRHTSLDPASAAYMTNHPDWQAVMANSAFQTHRRAPSEVSEISSAAHSPFLQQHDSFDTAENNPSPLLAPQNDPSLYENAALGIESFTLSEHQQQGQQQGFSPNHSPYISPQLMPQQTTDMIPSGPFISAPATSSIYPTPPTEGYANETEANAQQANVYGDIGQASQMAPPSINVEFAPPAGTQPFPNDKSTADIDSLSPPLSMRASRLRSKSDPYTLPAASRPRSPSSPSSNLDAAVASSPRSLSPFDVNRHPYSNPSSREPSPARSARRVSTSSINDNRSYILGLADPQRPGANSSDSKRVQKHPATFQCHLCPKRFTRAYNLRSHLRTHTDERPFVCTVCGKAFARQHDRKRHEGLHSGEKKFVCRGDLSRGGQWGCGRRFARADALGRHFRSEAGRICIKPLLDEESQERERTYMDQQQQHLQPMPQPLMVPGQGIEGQHSGNFILPAALLAQYPALQTLQWDQIPAGTDDPSDIGGRSSFDASSGGEFGFDDDESGISVSGMSGGYASDHGNMYGMDTQQQMLGVNPGESYSDQKWGK
ncbi:putative C2H2 transcription factor Crz1 [Aspergillus lucknowensis]|uniref:C2H2-type domain-containing protein n=1 Tax=Aspergillus lucknowensis TaxID=176173 RepID=A0ABR4LJI2_9EURO